ncbi:MAG TPA: sigma-70 family RNA polymerase sigma factor [Luteitalea sp.]|nr:sigma-70 family RNA polymerase sigma factor [Luteitalea sp.]
MKRDSNSERALIEQLQSGDPLAVDTLARTYGAKVYQLAFRYMKNREDAEEVAQDVLMKVINKVDAFRGDAALSSWIYRITFNTAMSRLRNGKFSRPAEVPESEMGHEQEDGVRRLREPADWTGLADEVVLRRELRERLADAMEELPEIYRTPIVLRDIQGLSTEEASQVLNVKSQTLKSRLHRGRLILRERLSDFSDGLTLHSVA